MSVRRGRPPVLAGGISGSSRAHWASVKSLGNPWPDCRCVSRCSLVHMPNHRLPIVVETVNHANLSDARNSWVRLLVIFPQALRRFLPPWINTVVDMVKGSALVSLVGIVDLMLAVQQVIGGTFQPLPLYVLGALIYFAINYTLSQLSRRLEARFAYVRE